MGQPGVTELPVGAEGEGGDPGQAAGQEQQAGVGDAAPGAVAETEGGEARQVGRLADSRYRLWSVTSLHSKRWMAVRAGSCWPSQLDTMWSVRFGHPPRLREVEMAVSGLGPVTSSLRLCDGEHLHPVDAPALGFGHD